MTIAAMFTAVKTLRILWSNIALKMVMRALQKLLEDRLNRWNAARTSLSDIQIRTIGTKDAGNISNKMASALSQLNLALATM